MAGWFGLEKYLYPEILFGKKPTLEEAKEIFEEGPYTASGALSELHSFGRKFEHMVHDLAADYAKERGSLKYRYPLVQLEDIQRAGNHLISLVKEKNEV